MGGNPQVGSEAVYEQVAANTHSSCGLKMLPSSNKSGPGTNSSTTGEDDIWLAVRAKR